MLLGFDDEKGHVIIASAGHETPLKCFESVLPLIQDDDEVELRMKKDKKSRPSFLKRFLSIFVVLMTFSCVKVQEAVWDEKHPIHWEHNKFPLTVSTEVYPEALEYAVDLWNDQADCDLFKVVQENARIRILEKSIEVGAETEDSRRSRVSSERTE